MHLMKTFVLRRIKVSNCFSNSVIQSVVCRRHVSSASNSIDEAEPTEKSTLASGPRKVMKGPFIKNLFAGVFDPDILEYPEYPSMENIKQMETSTIPVEEYVLNSVDSNTIDEMNNIPPDILQTMKEYQLYGLQAPLSLGGMDIDNKSTARYFESVGSDFSVATSLSAHNRSLNALLLYGTEIQKEQIVKKLASGEINVGFCLVEKPNILDISDIDTEALPGKNDDWVMNGKKIWVTNGNNADYFLVFAKTWRGTVGKSAGLTVFLVDRNTPGVECSDNIEQLGTKGVGLCNVTFKDVVVPKENVVGEFGDGANIAMTSLSNGWLNSSAACIGYLKKLLNSVTDFTIHTKIGGKAIYTQEHIQKQLGSIAADIYALESMVYLTAGFKDDYVNPDVSLEESIVKIFSTEKVVEIVDSCAMLVGGTAYTSGSLIERCIRDSRSYLLHDVVPTNVTKIYIATHGLHHAGGLLQSEIKKARNPLNFPSFALKNFVFETNPLSVDFKVPELLRLNLHPSLSGDADKLENAILRFEFVTKGLLKRWGSEIVDRHMDLIRLTDCIVSVYAMIAVVARASRSYCIGLTNSNHDLVASNGFCAIAFDRIKYITDLIDEGPLASSDSQCIHIGKEVVTQKGYFYEHPLARNY